MTAHDPLRRSPEGALRVLHSVRFRLMLWSLAMMALVLVAFSLFVYSRQQADLAALDQASLAKTLDAFQMYFKTYSLLYNKANGWLAAPGTEFNLPPMPPPGIKEMRAIIAPDGQVIWSQGEYDPQLLAKFLIPFKKQPRPMNWAKSSNLPIHCRANQPTVLCRLVFPL